MMFAWAFVIAFTCTVATTTYPGSSRAFADEFATNDVWKHFRAVKEGRVYDLPYDQFGMSATFNYPDALQTLQPMLYSSSSQV